MTEASVHALPIAPDLARRESQDTRTISGVEVHYWHYEPMVRTEQTRTVLVIHGFRGDHHGLARVVEELANMEIYSPDLPGFGASEAFTDREHSIENYAQFVADFMAATSLGTETVLLGHSFGSIVASYFSAEHPGAISELILINPIAAPALEGPKGVLSKLAEFYYLAAAKIPSSAGNALLRSKLIVYFMSVTMAKTKDRQLLSYIHGQHNAYFSGFANREMLLEAFRASIGGTVRQVATALNLPVLLIAGDKDEIAPLPSQRVLLGQLPDAELVVISDVGHLIHYETPAPAASAIIDFLARHPR
ncbi:MAG: alpha/beta hydrolase [Acidobacteria bacterium]|nr:alpha/beta hydrolase [Acidobacteriota bacterium]